MLEVKRLSRWFGTIHAVRDISFCAERGEVLGFLGPNGAGKTTTMRMITGFLPPTSGTAVIAGHDIVEDPVGAKKQIGYLPENAPVYGDMTVWSYLKFIAEIRGFTGLALRQRVKDTIAECRLDAVAHQTVGTLSKGFNQRVCFAQALLHSPPMLILDEPTDGLDPNQKHVVRGMIREMSRDKAIIISTHILEEVDAVCTRAIIIRNGTIVANGAPAELKRKSGMHGAVELLIEDAGPDVKAKLESLKAAARVEAEGNIYTIFPKSSNHLFEQSLELVKSNAGWKLGGIRVLEGRLDEVFRELTTSQLR